MTAYESDGSIARSTEGDGIGRYALSDLSPGSYRLEYEREDQLIGSYAKEFYNDKNSLASADPIEVADGQSIDGIDVQLASAAPSNDSFSAPEAVSGLPASASAACGEASNEPGEPGGGRTVWFAWQAPRSGPIELTLDHGGVVTAYTGEAIQSLTEVKAKRSKDGHSSVLRFNALEGTLYRVSVSCLHDGERPLTLSFRTTVNGPIVSAQSLKDKFHLGFRVKAAAKEDVMARVTGVLTIHLTAQPEHDYKFRPVKKSIQAGKGVKVLMRLANPSQCQRVLRDLSSPHLRGDSIASGRVAFKSGAGGRAALEWAAVPKYLDSSDRDEARSKGHC